MGERKNLVYPITAPDGTQIMPKRQWLWSRERAEAAVANGEIAFLKDKDGGWSVNTKQYLKDVDGNVRQSKAFSIIDDIYTQHGTNEIIELFSDAQLFPFPKPSKLLFPLLNLAMPESDGIVLDFFSGSGSLAHAVLELNKLDNGSRKFILVQLPEPTRTKKDDGSWLETAAWKAGYPTIADITKERVRRVIKKINDEEAGQLALNEKQDRGFRVFKLAESNFKAWDASAPKDTKSLAKQLELHVEHIRAGRTSEDILYEILFKSGFALTTPVEKIEVAGKSAYSVAGGGMLICLEKDLTLEAIRAMAELKPQRVVCLDLGFAGNDQLKTNAVQIFKNKEIVFKTV
jgi:adenine-specific DNA-methyltransferase